MLIPRHPVRVCWRICNLDYVMMEVRPAEIKAAMKKHPNVIGIPTMYAIVDDDVEWWPQCEDGEPAVVASE